MESHGSTSASPVSADPLDMFDFIKYNESPYQSPSLSPTASSKAQFVPSTTMVTTPTTLPSNQMLSGPSHQYDAYKQQTPFVPGALANTLAINEANVHMANYNLDYISPADEFLDFNSTPSQNSMTTPDMDIDFDSSTSAEPNFFFTTTPAANPQPRNSTVVSATTQAGTVGRMYPGMHAQRAAIAKAQAEAQSLADARQENKLQHQMEMMRRQEQQRRQQQVKQTRPKTSQPTDPIVEQKITQLLNQMRSSPTMPEPEAESPLVQAPRLKKEQDEMDEDERLLASEEGKKLTSKERRQLRNKVSARAFRSRRKEYIGQLESEIASKVSENNDLRAENRALSAENDRLTNLARMLLSSSSFSNFLDTLSQNTNTVLSPVQPQMDRRQPEPTQVPKDPNPYNTTPFGQQQQIGMVMVPEPSMDFSTLHNPGPVDFFQPHVFTVLETPEIPEIDTETLMGKSSNFVDEAPASDSDKTEIPSLEAPVPSIIEKLQAPEMSTESAPAEEKVLNLDGDIFEDEDVSVAAPRPLELDTDGFSSVDIFGGIEPEKAFARYELVDASEEEKIANMALKRVERLAASLAATISGLERLDTDV